MWKSLVQYIVVLILGIVLGSSVTLLFSGKNSAFLPSMQLPVSELTKGDNGSRTIYPRYTFQGQFAGSGEVTHDVTENLLVIAKKGRQMKTVPIKDEALYNAKDYNIYHQKGKKNVLEYAVGYIKGWEKLPGTKDRLLVLVDPQDSSKVLKYRVAFQRGGVFAGNETKFGVQNLGMVAQGKNFNLQRMKPSLLDISEQNLATLLPLGNVAIVVPIYDFVETVKTDNTGTILADWVYVRRDNGILDLPSAVRKLFPREKK